MHRVTVKDQQPESGFGHLLLLRRALTAEVTRPTPTGTTRSGTCWSAHPRYADAPDLVSELPEWHLRQ